MIRILLLSVVLGSGVALAQNADTPPPPLVDAPTAPPAPADAPKKDEPPPTPPPPGAHLPGSQGQTGYAYSPYGQPLNPTKEPPREYGLIATEFLFGALTAAPIVLLPYFLFLRCAIRPETSASCAGQGLDPSNRTLFEILFFVIFASVPVAVAQTEIGIANGSRYYYSENWPAYLSGLVAQAAVIGIYYLAGPGSATAEMLLLVGTMAGVPAAETAAINLTKVPRSELGGFGLVNHSPGRGWSFSKPQLVPIFSRGGEGLRLGLSVPVMAGSF